MAKQEETTRAAWTVLPNVSPGKADAVAFLQKFGKPNNTLLVGTFEIS